MSQRDSGYERKERDLYETPEWVTRALCDHLYYKGWSLGCVWEPAAASGKMLDVLARYADPGCAIGSDIAPLRADVRTLDFLTDDPPVWRGPFGQNKFGAIVTNPPFEVADKFIERSLRYFDGKSVSKIAMLLRTDYDHAKSRSHLFRDCPAFQTKLVLTRRIMWFPPEPGAKGKSPSFNHAWYIWDWKHEGAPTIAYGP